MLFTACHLQLVLTNAFSNRVQMSLYTIRAFPQKRESTTGYGTVPTSEPGLSSSVSTIMTSAAASPVTVRFETVAVAPVSSAELGITTPTTLGTSSTPGTAHASAELATAEEMHVSGVPAGAPAMGSEGGHPLAARTVSMRTKSPLSGKGRGARKSSPKPSPVRSLSGGRESPVSSKVNGPPSPSVESVAISTGPAVDEKLLLDSSGTTGASSASKKPNTAVEPRAPTAKKRVTAPVASLPKGPEPAPARVDVEKKSVVGKANASNAGGVKGAAPGAVTGSEIGAVQAPATSTPAKRARRVDQELDVVNGVVEIEAEEDRLGVQPVNADDIVLVAEDIYYENMLLVGGRLRAKLQAITNRFMHENDGVTSEVMEMISLAVEERL